MKEREGRRRLPRAAAVLAAVAVAAGASAAPTPRKDLAWSFGTQTHRMRVGPPLGEGAGRGLELPPGRRRLPARSDGQQGWASDRRTLLSVVGPIVSRYHEYEGHHGAGGWVTQHIETEWLDGFTFDLRGYLARSVGLGPELLTADFSRFAVVDWDGADRLSLRIERTGCEMQRPGCALDAVLVTTAPPAGWRPWLEAARRGEGLLQARAGEWWTKALCTTPRAPIR